MTLQLIYIGPITSPVKLKGTIEGVAGPVDDSTLRQVQFWKEYGKKVLACFALVCIVFGINFVVPFLLKSSQKVLGERFAKYVRPVGTIMLAVALLVFFAWIAVLSPIREAKQQADQTVAEAIPTCLR